MILETTYFLPNRNPPMVELISRVDREYGKGKPGGEKVNKILDLVNKGEFKDALKILMY